MDTLAIYHHYIENSLGGWGPWIALAVIFGVPLLIGLRREEDEMRRGASEQEAINRGTPMAAFAFLLSALVSTIVVLAK